MADIIETWKRLDTLLVSVDGASEELGPPATDAQIALLEAALSITLPPDFKKSLRCHDGAGRVLFLVGDYRLWPIAEIIEVNSNRRSLHVSNEFSSGDATGCVKDLIYNPLWIEFGDNGGNGAIAIDLDPGEKGLGGQIIGLYEDGVDLLADSISAFLVSTANEIESGARTWDAIAGQWSAVDN